MEISLVIFIFLVVPAVGILCFLDRRNPERRKKTFLPKMRLVDWVFGVLGLVLIFGFGLLGGIVFGVSVWVYGKYFRKDDKPKEKQPELKKESTEKE